MRTIKLSILLKGVYRVYGIEAAGLLFGLESGTGEPNA
jgi:hypothetical protein